MLNSMVYLFILLFLSIWIDKTFNDSTKNSGRVDLEDWMNHFEWGKGDIQQEINRLPRYKFYSDLIELILKYARTYGGKYQDSFLLIKDSVRSDMQFEKKMKELILSNLMQMLMILLITWGFIFSVQNFGNVHVSKLSLAFVGLWQFLGMMILPLGITYYRKIFFQDIAVLWKFYYSLNCLIHIPFSRSELFNISGIQSLKKIKQKSLHFLVNKSFVMGQDVLKKGSPFEERLQSLMQELKFIEKWHFELFEKRLGVIKLVILGAFLLPSYLLFIFFILQHLMSLM